MKRTVFLLVGLMACNSPLLNHVNADDLSRKDPSAAGEPLTADDAKNCPLAFPEAGLCAELIWKATPTADELATFTLKFWNEADADRKGPYVSPTDEPFVKLWMTSMGHGSSPVKLAPARDAEGAPVDGVYDGTDAFFSMGGDWDVKVQLRREKKVQEEAVLKVKI
ncbi:MAG: hypothetical protein AB7P04_05410 [Bacteriovoracia bacterium]